LPQPAALREAERTRLVSPVRDIRHQASQNCSESKRRSNAPEFSCGDQLSRSNDARVLKISLGAPPYGFRSEHRADSYNSSLGGGWRLLQRRSQTLWCGDSPSVRNEFTQQG
jgi:hypothetical protein